MPQGGARPGAGRKPRGANKATKERQERIAATGVTPIDVLIDGMRRHYAAAIDALKGEEPDKETAAKSFKEAREFAKEAAPYVHPKLASVVHKGNDNGPIQIVISGSDSGLL